MLSSQTLAFYYFWQKKKKKITLDKKLQIELSITDVNHENDCTKTIT